MTERMKSRLLDLKERQAAGGEMLCPRCGRSHLKAELYTNALSRHVDGIYICDECGTAEALLDFMHQELPLTMWAAFQPKRPSSAFQSMSAVDVLAAVLHEQTETLTEIYKLCLSDPDDQDEYRQEAFERCPGLTELWTSPFTAKYATAESPVMIRFRLTDDGSIEVAGNIIGAKLR